MIRIKVGISIDQKGNRRKPHSRKVLLAVDVSCGDPPEMAACKWKLGVC